MKTTNHITMVIAALMLSLTTGCLPPPNLPKASLPTIMVKGTGFVKEATQEEFFPLGFNYLGHDRSLIEELWNDPNMWNVVLADFREMSALGANVIRLHMQIGWYLDDETHSNTFAFRKLEEMVDYAASLGMYVHLTGLAVYRPGPRVAWLDSLTQEERWNAQAFFWGEVARTLSDKSSVLVYDLINEPGIVPGMADDKWYTGELDGFHFNQYIAHVPEATNAEMDEIGRQWTERMIAAIKQYDNLRPITIGILYPIPDSPPILTGIGVVSQLDVISPHLYPKTGSIGIIQNQVNNLRTNEVTKGMPLLVGETFPLGCSGPQWELFLYNQKPQVAGFISHYDGRNENEISESINNNWNPDMDPLWLRGLISWQVAFDNLGTL